MLRFAVLMRSRSIIPRNTFLQCYETIAFGAVIVIVSEYDGQVKQGHHHNGDEAAKRPHIMWSICGRRFTTPLFGARWDRGRAHSVARPRVPICSPLTHMVYLLTLFELFSWLQKRFRVRPTRIR